MSEMIVREATESDGPRLSEIWALADLTTAESDPSAAIGAAPPPDRLVEVLGHADGEDWPAWFVAEADGRVVGFQGCRIIAKASAWTGRKVGGLNFFAVDPAFQGGGVGRMLCERVLRFLAEHQVEFVRVTASRDYRAVQAYEAMGLRVFRYKPYYQFDASRPRFAAEPAGPPVRPMAADDLAAVHELWAQTVCDTQDWCGPVLHRDFPQDKLRAGYQAQARTDEFRQAIAARREQIWVTAPAGQVVAFACFAGQRSPYRLEHLAVAADQRGRGLGPALLAAALRGLRARQADLVVNCQVFLDNVAAVRMVERCGFLYRSIGTALFGRPRRPA